MRGAFLTALLVSAALAGCVDGGSESDSDRHVDPSRSNERLQLPDNFMPDGGDHDHADPDAHQFLFNYDLSSHDPLLSNQANMAGLHVLDRKGDHLFGGVWGSHDASADGGLVIWDLSDPANPVETGRYTIPGSIGGDRSLEVTDDGDFAVLGLEKLTCFGQVSPSSSIQAYLFDTSDKSNPVPVDVITVTSQSAGERTGVSTITNGFHSVTVHNINGEDYAFIFGNVYHIDRNATEGAGGQHIADSPTARLDKVNTLAVGHDMYIRNTPWGDAWGLTATGDRFFVLYNLNDPTFEDTVGFWDLDERPDVREGGVTYYFHTADATFFDDQTIIVMTSEDAGDHVSPFWILDATDPTDLQHIGTWGNPFGVHAQHVIFSQHTQRFHDDGIMTLTHYHGGFVQFDFRHPDFRGDPAIIAYGAVAPQAAPVLADAKDTIVQDQLCGLSAEDDPAPGVHIPEVVYYMDVEVGNDGIVYIADAMGGLLTFTPTADHPVYGDQWS